MRRLAQGPLPVALLAAFGASLAIAYWPLAPAEESAPPFPLVSLLSDLWEQADLGGLRVLAAFCIGFLGASLFALVYRLTSTHVVSLAAAILCVFHPAILTDAMRLASLSELLSAAFAFLSLAALRQRVLATTPTAKRRSTLSAFALALCAGLSGLSSVLMLPAAFVIEALWPPREGARRRALRSVLLVLPGVLLGLLFCLAAKPSRDLFPAQGFARWPTAIAVGWQRIGLRLPGILGLLVLVFSLIAALVLTEAVRRAGRRGAVRHLSAQISLAAAVFGALGFASLWLKGQFNPLAFAFLPFVAVSFAWRLLLTAMPEPLPRPDEPPFARELLQGLLVPKAAQTFGGSAKDSPEVRRVVQECLLEAFTPERANSPSGMSALEQRHEAAAGRLRRRLERALPKAWRARALERELYQSFVCPFVTRGAQVLELAPKDSLVTEALLADGAVVTCLGREQKAEALLQETAAAAYVPLRADLERRWPIAPARVDLVIAHQHFLKTSAPLAAFALREIARVLRPGGRVLIECTCLEAPRATEQLLAESRGLLAPESPPLFFGSADTWRALAAAADLRVEALHVAALDRDSVLVLEKEPR